MNRRYVGLVMGGLMSVSLLTTLALEATAQPNRPLRVAAEPAASESFHKLAESYLADYLRLNPESATVLGEHSYDGQWSDLSPAGLAAMRAFCQSSLDQLDKIPPDGLDPVDRIDAEIMRTNLLSGLFTFDELKEYEWNPLLYNPGSALFGLLARDYAPEEQRLQSLRQRLSKIEQLLGAARANLKHPPRIFTETAISQNQGLIAWLKSDLPAKDPALMQARDHALQELEAYGQWLEKDLLPVSNGDFRLGDKLYRKKLAFTLESDFTPEQIMQRAQTELHKTHAEMTAVARQLYPELVGHAPAASATDRQICKDVLDKLADLHPTNQTILAEARQDLETSIAFVKEKKIVSLPTEHCDVIEMPEFNRGVAVAYCDSPGPLEKKGGTFYAIAPTPKDWTAKRAESFYREYNHAMLKDLTVHEAMPGHFLQLMAANRFKAPTRLRAVFQSGTFVEGWATYTEQVMAAQGFGGPRFRMQQLKMRLRLILNSILDQGVHAGKMTEKEAEQLLMKEGFQEEGEAVGKWRRACLSSAQLSTYFVGNCEVNELCAAYRSQHPQASLQETHDRVLSFGSPAPRYIRRLLGLK